MFTRHELRVYLKTMKIGIYKKNMLFLFLSLSSSYNVAAAYTKWGNLHFHLFCSDFAILYVYFFTLFFFLQKLKFSSFCDVDFHHLSYVSRYNFTNVLPHLFFHSLNLCFKKRKKNFFNLIYTDLNERSEKKKCVCWSACSSSSEFF